MFLTHFICKVCILVIHFSINFLFLGYQGFGCTDDSKAWSRGYYLIRVSLLTLSNIIFLVATIYAIYLHHFAESVSYLATTVFSTVSVFFKVRNFKNHIQKMNIIYVYFTFVVLKKGIFHVHVMVTVSLLSTCTFLSNERGLAFGCLSIDYTRTNLYSRLCCGYLAAQVFNDCRRH